MMRLVALSIAVIALAGCSGSGRVANVVPSWANTPQRLEPSQAQNETPRARSEPQNKPDVATQETKQSEVRSLAEE